MWGKSLYHSIGMFPTVFLISWRTMWAWETTTGWRGEHKRSKCTNQNMCKETCILYKTCCIVATLTGTLTGICLSYAHIYHKANVDYVKFGYGFNRSQRREASMGEIYSLFLVPVSFLTVAFWNDWRLFTETMDSLKALLLIFFLLVLIVLFLWILC